MTRGRLLASIGVGAALAGLTGWGLAALELVTEPDPPLRPVVVLVWTEWGVVHSECVCPAVEE